MQNIQTLVERLGNSLFLGSNFEAYCRQNCSCYIWGVAQDLLNLNTIHVGKGQINYLVLFRKQQRLVNKPSLFSFLYLEWTLQMQLSEIDFSSATCIWVTCLSESTQREVVAPGNLGEQAGTLCCTGTGSYAAFQEAVLSVDATALLPSRKCFTCSYLLALPPDLMFGINCWAGT